MNEDEDELSIKKSASNSLYTKLKYSDILDNV